MSQIFHSKVYLNVAGSKSCSNHLRDDFQNVKMHIACCKLMMYTVCPAESFACNE
eukprot:c42302_g1_i1 orf=2-163(-)